MSLLDNVMNALGENAMSGHGEQLASHLGGGGLEMIISKLQEGGLGNIIQSWVGTGANLPIGADQLHSVLGADHVAMLSSALGINGSQLASVLPGLINHLTPDGKLPEGGIGDLVSSAISSGALKNIIGGFLR